MAELSSRYQLENAAPKERCAGVTSARGNNADRELWLYRVAEAVNPRFAALGHPEPPIIRIGVGYPSAGARGKAIGQCYDSCVSKDKVHEIIISPVIDDSIEVAGVLGHELVHAFLQNKFPDENCGHGKKFKTLAVALGLTGKMTATVPGEPFKRFLQPTLTNIGQYPHGALERGHARKVQGTRLVKVVCSACEYTMRVTRKWIDVAIPTCPNPECDLRTGEMEVVK
jgi:hypothetical protein